MLRELPRTKFHLYIQFHAWRVFVVLCALPSVCAATALTFLYESPRWQLRSGFTKQALITLQKVHEINYSARGDTVHQLEADLSAEPQPVDPGLTEISRATDSFMSRISVRFLTALDEILTGTKLIFDVSSPIFTGYKKPIFNLDQININIIKLYDNINKIFRNTGKKRYILGLFGLVCLLLVLGFRLQFQIKSETSDMPNIITRLSNIQFKENHKMSKRKYSIIQ